MRSQRDRTRPVVGRKRRSNSRARSTVPTIESSSIVCTPSRRSPRRPSAATTSSKGRITFTSLASRRRRAARRDSARLRRSRPKSNCASVSGWPVSRAMGRTVHLPTSSFVSMATPARTPRLSPVLRSEDRVTPLELFFDLVFVLALTQCTALMAEDPTWGGLAKGLLLLGLMWWSWVGYAWLTSVVDPEEGLVRFAMFAAMAALLVVALCLPQAFGDRAVLFACAYGIVRFGQVLLLAAAGRDDPALLRSVGALVDDEGVRAAIWAFSLLLDMGEPYLFGSEGWKLVPRHFVERHGLIVIIALGESIVAIGVGAEAVDVDAGVVA